MVHFCLKQFTKQRRALFQSLAEEMDTKTDTSGVLERGGWGMKSTLDWLEKRSITASSLGVYRPIPTLASKLLIYS